MAWVSFADIGDELIIRGWETQCTPAEKYEELRGKVDSIAQIAILSSIARSLHLIVANQGYLERRINKLPKDISNAIAAGEERKAKAEERKAKAEERKAKAEERKAKAKIAQE